MATLRDISQVPLRDWQGHDAHWCDPIFMTTKCLSQLETLNVAVSPIPPLILTLLVIRQSICWRIILLQTVHAQVRSVSTTLPVATQGHALL